MKGVAIVAIAILSVLAVSFVLRKRSEKRPSSRPAPEEVYRGLRGLALGFSRAKIGLPPAAAPTEPWGVIMDWGVASGPVSIVAIADGSASIYMSNGGGYLGGIGHESIRKAARNMVAAAAEVQKETTATTVYPLPRRGEVIFYLLTDAGIFTARGSEGELKAHSHFLSKLGEAGQDVITQYRLIQK
jgi:hypothetical protein